MDQPDLLLVLALAAALVVVVALGWACYRLLVDRGQLLLRLDETAGQPPPPRGLPLGAHLNDFALPALDGELVTLSGLAGRPLLLTVVRPSCLFSRTLVQELRDITPTAETPLPVLIVSGESDDPRRLAPFTGLPGLVVHDAGGQAVRLLRVSVTPAGYLVDGQRRTTSRLLLGPEALLAAARGAAATAAPAHPAAVTPITGDGIRAAAGESLGPGDNAPEFTLPLLDGGTWSLRAQRGQPVTLLFSDPGCPPCWEMLDALGARGAAVSAIVGRGDAGEIRQLCAERGITAPVLMQHGREVARAFGTLQTPAAFVIDAAGTIAAGPGIGVIEALAVIAASDLARADGPGAVARDCEDGGSGDGRPDR
jgi:peroxiredoxin